MGLIACQALTTRVLLSSCQALTACVLLSSCQALTARVLLSSCQALNCQCSLSFFSFWTLSHRRSQRLPNRHLPSYLQRNTALPL